MAVDFSKFDSMVDTQGLQDDIYAASQNNVSFQEVPAGQYEVKVEKMELVETGPNSQNPGMPMVSIWFKILAGEFKGQLIFYNKVIMGTRNDGLMIHNNNEFLKRLDSGLEVKFLSYSQYAQLLLDIHEAVDGSLEYLLEYGENKKGFKTYEIKDIYEVE